MPLGAKCNREDRSHDFLRDSNKRKYIRGTYRSMIVNTFFLQSHDESSTMRHGAGR